MPNNTLRRSATVSRPKKRVAPRISPVNHFDALAVEMIQRAERIDCSLSEFYHGLVHIRRALEERCAIAHAEGVDIEGL